MISPFCSAMKPKSPGRCQPTIFGYERNRLRRLCIGFIGRHREKIPQYLEVILESGTDHKIGHRNCLPFIEYGEVEVAYFLSRPQTPFQSAARGVERRIATRSRNVREGPSPGTTARHSWNLR